MADPITPPPVREAEDILSSWKEIAVYLGRSVRAVQNWEKEEGLPIHRHRHVEGASVFAYRFELDAWSRARVQRGAAESLTPESLPEAAPPLPPAAPARRWIALGGLLVIVLLAMGISMWRSAPPPPGSIAILPLRPLGPSDGVEHLGLGIADAIVYQLSASRSIAVTPTSISRTAAARASDVRDIAGALGVDAVLEGTIQRSESRIRIRVQLVDARLDRSIYSGKFDEDASDLFAVEDTVAGAVARALSLELDPSGQELAARRRSPAPGAYEAYLKGRFQWEKRTPEALEASIASYEEALSRDPDYAAAWAALGESLNLLSMHRVRTPDESFPRAKVAASRALELDANLADAHLALGTAAFYYDLQWHTAERHLRRALELEPAHAAARHILANLMVASSRHEEAAAIMDEAIRRDPTSITLLSVSSFQRYQARDFDDGVRRARAALDRDSGYVQAHGSLGFNLLARGDFAEGIAEVERFHEMIGPDTHATADLASAYAYDPSRRAEARAMLPRLLGLYAAGKISPYDLARYHAVLGDTDEALHYLEETRARRDPGMVWLATDPRFDGLRELPRFQALVRLVNRGDERGLHASRPDRTHASG